MPRKIDYSFSSAGPFQACGIRQLPNVRRAIWKGRRSFAGQRYRGSLQTARQTDPCASALSVQ